MPASSKRSYSVSIPIRMPPELFARAAKRADGMSFHSYLTRLLCADMGLDVESQDLYFHSRRTWHTDYEGHGPRRVTFLLPSQLHRALEAKLAALPYPVNTSSYLRRLIERDLG